MDKEIEEIIKTLEEQLNDLPRHKAQELADAISKDAHAAYEALVEQQGGDRDFFEKTVTSISTEEVIEGLKVKMKETLEK